MHESSEIRHRFIDVNGVRLHYVEAGTGPLAVLLHGFPEFWYSWRHQIPVLAAAGFHVLALDMRGYNESDKPRGVESYRMALLTEDVAQVVQHVGGGRGTVIGHDWGGAIAWDVAMNRPDVVERLVVLNGPHPAAFQRELRTPGQLRRSWYIFFFQLPWLPERRFRAGNYAMLERTLRGEPHRPGAFSDADIQRYKDALSRPGALTAAINYYRAAMRHRRRLPQRLHPIHVPTLLLWGERDRYLGPRLLEGLEPWVPGLQIRRFPNASHWLQNEEPEQVNAALLAFLKAGR
jgi:pimeloyl-ACP methyl ester carboxylesterase